MRTVFVVLALLLVSAAATLVGLACGHPNVHAPAVVEPARDQIRMPHDVHQKAGVKCITCHEGVYDETVLGTAAEALPSEATCLDCHNDQKDKKNCAFCHSDVEHAAKRVLVPNEIKMSHAKHIDLVKEDCTQCHTRLQQGFATADDIPKMSACLTCHDHSAEYAQTRCTSCHPSIAKLASLKPLHDFSHQQDFVRTHAADARASAETCAQCHEQTFCADCHAKTVSTRIEVKYPEEVQARFIHREDYLGRHEVDAVADPVSCARCHGKSFCNSCHQAQNLTPAATNPRDPHPFGWSLPGSASFHGPAAREDIASCASCHDQGPRSNCITCHKVGGTGGNPHPASWLSHHDISEVRSHAMCTYCHL